MVITIDIDDFKTLFSRGQFTYGTLPDIRDEDIENAIGEADAVFNPDLYPTEEIGIKAKLYLTAHFLQCDLEASESNGQAKFLQSSRSVGSISESVSIPEWMNNSEFSFYATTYYGQKYLILSKPYLDGNVGSVTGGTNF